MILQDCPVHYLAGLPIPVAFLGQPVFQQKPRPGQADDERYVPEKVSALEGYDNPDGDQSEGQGESNEDSKGAPRVRGEFVCVHSEQTLKDTDYKHLDSEM